MRPDLRVLLVQLDLLARLAHKAPRDRRVLRELLVFLQQVLDVTHVDSRLHQMMGQKRCHLTDGHTPTSEEPTTTSQLGLSKTLGAPLKRPVCFSKSYGVHLSYKL